MGRPCYTCTELYCVLYVQVQLYFDLKQYLEIVCYYPQLFATCSENDCAARVLLLLASINTLCMVYTIIQSLTGVLLTVRCRLMLMPKEEAASELRCTMPASTITLMLLSYSSMLEQMSLPEILEVTLHLIYP